ncbi:MAG: DNA primase [Chloroflexota bacterium]
MNVWEDAYRSGKQLMSSVDEIKARIDVVDLVSETVQLRRTGKNYIGFCPFHSNTRTPAFVVFPESGTWRCFGQCNEGGDIFGFVMKKEGVDFSQALRILAEKAGVQLKPPSPQEAVEREEHEALRTVLEDAATFYRHQLLKTPAGQPALEYLHRRGLSDDTLEAFGLGYAPNAWDAALSYFTTKKVEREALLAAGLVVEGENGQTHDRFRNRIMIPIRDEQGRMAGFGARILDPKDVPKFLNSPQTAVFDKGKLLYGLDRARRAIRTQDQAVIVEGYLDVIALHQAGFTNVVSPMGTALTEQQLFLLKRFSKRLVLALDSDAAGAQATLRGLELARQTMDRTNEVAFNARGLLSFEARLQADIRVTTLPPGVDPDEVVQRDPKEWEQLVQSAQPIVVHVMETLAASRDVNDPKAKDEIARQVLPLIQDVPSPLERDSYLQRLARLLKVDERALLASAGAARRAPARRRTAVAAPTAEKKKPAVVVVPGGSQIEAHVLGVLLRNPELLYRIDRHLQEEQLDRLSEADFRSADHKTLFRYLQQSMDQDVAEPLHFVLDRLSLELMEIADAILAKTKDLDASPQRLVEDVLRGGLQLRQQNIIQTIEYQRFQIEEAQAQGDPRATQYQKVMVQLSQTLLKLNRALKKYTSR